MQVEAAHSTTCEFVTCVNPRCSHLPCLAQGDLASSNAAIRNSAIGLLGVAHRQLGAGLADMLRPHVKPALMSALDDTFAKNPQQEVLLSPRPLAGPDRDCCPGPVRRRVTDGFAENSSRCCCSE